MKSKYQYITYFICLCVLLMSCDNGGDPPSVSLDPPSLSDAGSGSTYASPVSLKWEPVPDATHYTLQVAQNNTFSSTIINKGLSDTKYVDDGSLLLANERYYWRVRSHNATLDSDWSTVASFSVKDTSSPPPSPPTSTAPEDIPILKTPTAGSITTSPITFTWGSVENATEYTIAIASSSNNNVGSQGGFVSPIIHQKVSDTVYVSSSLSSNQIYYWQVRSHKGNALSKWSPIIPFIIGDPNASHGILSGRTLQIIYAISSALNGLAPSAITIADLSRVTLMEAYGVGIDSLKSNDLNGLINLVSLNLSDNLLTTLPEDIFVGLNKLEWLFIFGNKIETVPENVFNRLPSIKGIFLDDNEIVSLPANLFKGLATLERLWLYGNNIASLDQNIFKGLSKVNSLLLWKNNISSLPSGIFDDLANIGQLGLSENKLTTLPSGIFDQLSTLTSLQLDDNAITSLDSSLFVNLTNIGVLKLGSNQLTQLSSHLFNGLSNLTQIGLSNNDLTTIPQNIFYSNVHLTYIGLQKNDNINQLPTNIFQRLGRLKTLFLPISLKGSSTAQQTLNHQKWGISPNTVVTYCSTVEC